MVIHTSTMFIFFPLINNNDLFKFWVLEFLNTLKDHLPKFLIFFTLHKVYSTVIQHFYFSNENFPFLR